jgi:transposase
MSLDPKTIEAIHRLKHEQKLSARQIIQKLHVSNRTIRKYLQNPSPSKSILAARPSKLDPFKPIIRELLEQCPTVSSVVVEQRLKSLGFTGSNVIVKRYMATLRKVRNPAPRAYVRIESSSGECFQIDWGHFDSLDYEGDKRKLYAFCCVECYSRRLYVEFTHSQCFETFVRCHLHAFQFMGGIPRECLYDNLATAVAEHDGRIVRFNPRFLAFARELGFYPKACNKAAGWEKGKIERSVGYLRKNFLPLRSFTSLYDVNFQVRQWLDQTANKRTHRETRQIPDERFNPQTLRPLPPLLPDYRDTAAALVHKDIRLQFDGNRYCVPPRYVGLRLTVKADSQSVVIYDNNREVAHYSRSWRKGQSFGAERFEKKLLAERPPAERSAAQQRLILLLGETGDSYLRQLAQSDRSLSRQVTELLDLCRLYGPNAVSSAISKAHSLGAFDADYIKNILLQEQSPRQVQPPLQLNDSSLNNISTDPLSLLDYDALILSQRSDS